MSVHTVKDGDGGLYQIAQRYRVPFASMKQANPQLAGRSWKIYPGDQLTIPSSMLMVPEITIVGTPPRPGQKAAPEPAEEEARRKGPYEMGSNNLSCNFTIQETVGISFGLPAWATKLLTAADKAIAPAVAGAGRAIAQTLPRVGQALESMGGAAAKGLGGEVLAIVNIDWVYYLISDTVNKRSASFRHTGIGFGINPGTIIGIDAITKLVGPKAVGAAAAGSLVQASVCAGVNNFVTGVLARLEDFHGTPSILSGAGFAIWGFTDFTVPALGVVTSIPSVNFGVGSISYSAGILCMSSAINEPLIRRDVY